VVLLSDCVHNAGPDPRPFAARLPRLDVLLDASGEQDRWLGGELARLGRGKFRVAASYRDVAPALSSFFAELGSSRLTPDGIQEKQQRSVKRLWLTSGSRRSQWLSGGRRGACPHPCTAR
jgi:hypothetical protein